MRWDVQAVGLEAVSSTTVELARAVVADREKWGDVVRRSGARLD